MSWLGEQILLALSRKPGTPDYSGRTNRYTLSNALDFARQTIPDFLELIRGKTILDYGCGPGWQAVAMYQQGARQVVGIDIDDRWLSHGRTLAQQESIQQGVHFCRQVPEEFLGKFDLVISLSSFEHFRDPGSELTAMRAAVAPGGRVVISFAEPWLSHNGSHMGFFTRLPWVNVFFSENTIMRVRSRFRDDGATRLEDVTGGLNKMTLAKFARLIEQSGMALANLKFYPTRGLPVVARIPLLREFLVSSAACTLRKHKSGASAGQHLDSSIESVPAQVMLPTSSCFQGREAG